MKCFDLEGNWLLSQDGKTPIPGHLPGCTYLDYMANGMPDPFLEDNETAARELARHHYIYSREFDLPEKMLSCRHLDLVADGLDTLCTITLNGVVIAKTNNVNRVWRFDVLAHCKLGRNNISIDFENPYPYIEREQKAENLPRGVNVIPDIGHLRKTPSTFGWDFVPMLAPAGVTRRIGLEAYDYRIEDLRIKQLHSDGKVTVNVETELDEHPSTEMEAVLELTDPNGSKRSFHGKCLDAYFCWSIHIENPQLWWCNGLGAQPLYTLSIQVSSDGRKVDNATRKIGLRTIVLDTSKDEYGEQFRFVINGVPIFAKGANYVPADQFITRADKETIFFNVEAARKANMNMLRVWGGGTYETEEFYDACDEKGILIWQDSIFACNPYPLYKEEFLENVHAEVVDNVRRLRHRASLALWCGNNELDISDYIFPKDCKLKKYHKPFFYQTLKQWVEELDGVTPYWPGSPSSGHIDKKFHTFKKGEISGDTHLWQMYHGLRSTSSYRKYPTRFCSEYGPQTLPSMYTIRKFTSNPSLDLFDPVIMLHQKSSGGVPKMFYYMLERYRNPRKFEDFVYLTQLLQSEIVRYVTDSMRLNIGLQNGALFWQLNDCWPCASWSAIDYYKQLKAVMYNARHFNKMLSVLHDVHKSSIDIHVVNEYPEHFSGHLEWALKTFDGELINGGQRNVNVGSVAVTDVVTLDLRKMLHGERKNQVYLETKLFDGNKLMDMKTSLLVPEKYAKLPKPKLTYRCSVVDGKVQIVLESKCFAHCVFVESEYVTTPWSDNFFDMQSGETLTITAKLSFGIGAEDLSRSLRIKSFADVEPKNSLVKDQWIRFKMLMSDYNFFMYFTFRYLMG